MTPSSLRSPSRWMAAAGAFAGASLWVAAAHARACATEADCPHGFGCLGPGGSASEAIPPFPPTSPAADGGPGGVCSSLQCESNSDCGDGTRCELDVASVCTGGAGSCMPGNMCVPAWQARCTVDGDCGPGFRCSGSDGYDECAPPSAAKVPSYATATTVSCASLLPPLLPPPSWHVDLCDASTCTSITWSTCVAQPTGPCTVDADCPATWNCACPVGVGGGLVAGGDDAADASAATPAACTPQCLPPNSDLAPSYGSAGGGSFSGSALNGPTGGPARTPAGAVVDAGAAAVQRSGAAAPGASSRGGCQLAGRDPGAATPWAILLGLVVAQRVRARRRP
jgi:hypothetical protein